MAKVTVQRQWPDGDLLTIAIHVADSFPDTVNEARAAAIRAYAEALDVSLAADETSDELEAAFLEDTDE
jgi:hypothetical protein